MIVRDSPRVDELILQVALELFDERGYEGTSDLDVALRAGLTLTQVRGRFGGTQEMLGSLMDRATDLLFWQPAQPTTFDELVGEHRRLLGVDARLSRVIIREHRHLDNPYRRSWIARTAAYRERWAHCAPEPRIVATLTVLNNEFLYGRARP